MTFEMEPAVNLVFDYLLEALRRPLYLQKESLRILEKCIKMPFIEEGNSNLWYFIYEMWKPRIFYDYRLYLSH